MPPKKLDLAQIVKTQAAYRRQIAEVWSISSGSRILEIGCGQGDMTVALAEAVGPEGRVVAIDPASPDYGAPETIGQATSKIRESALGERIDFRLTFNFLEQESAFRDDEFDLVVLAHSSWYFASREELLRTLVAAKRLSSKLAIAEWDSTPRTFDQLGHSLAVLVQGQVEAFKATSQSNVRTPMSKSQLMKLLDEAGWGVTAEFDLDTAALQDAQWEIDNALRDARADMETLELPPKTRAVLEIQLGILADLADQDSLRSLPAYALLAQRAV